MIDQGDDKKKPENPSGSGRPGTKFMERPKPGQKKDPAQQPSSLPPADIGEEGPTDDEDIGGIQGQQPQKQQPPPQQGQQPQQKKGQQGKQGPGS